MENSKVNRITIETVIKAPIEKVWRQWSTPTDIMKWNNANDDWHTSHAENDLRTGGKFISRMEAKDGSFGFASMFPFVCACVHESSVSKRKEKTEILEL